MAIGAKRLIPRSTGARILFPCALSLIFCLPVVVGQDLPPNRSFLECHLLAETNLKGILEEAKLFDTGARKHRQSGLRLANRT